MSKGLYLMLPPEKGFYCCTPQHITCNAFYSTSHRLYRRNPLCLFFNICYYL